MSNESDQMYKGTPFSERQIRLASQNYENQVELVYALRQAFIASGRTIDEVAEAFDVPVEDMEEMLAAEVDLPFSDLRMLANELEVEIAYTVTPSTK